MDRLNFIDRRGDEYTIVRYSTNEIKVTKKKPYSTGFHEIKFSSEAVERLQEFLGV